MQQWRRFAPLSGLLFVALFVLALILLGSTGDTPEEVRAYYAENEGRIFAGFFVFIASALAYLWFVATLRSVLARVEAEPRPLAALAFGAGVATTALLVAGAAVFAAPAETADEGSLDAATADMLDTASYFLITGGIMVSSVLVLATSLLALRTRVLPRWLGWLGLVVAPVVFFAPFFLPVIAFLVWVALVSVLLMGRRGDERTAA